MPCKIAAEDNDNNNNMREIDVLRILQGDVYYKYQSIKYYTWKLGHSLS